jgi:hypothetical protein
MATTAEQLVQLLKNTNDAFGLINDLPQFKDGVADIVSRLGKAEKALTAHDKRITALEAALKAIPKPGT